MKKSWLVLLSSFLVFFNGCSSGGGGNGDSSGLCDGACPHLSLSSSDVSQIIKQAISASSSLGVNSTIAITDRVGNVLGIYQMAGASPTTQINGQIGASGGLEGLTVLSMSKTGTGSYLSSQGNAFSTRTASFIVQENFAPGQRNAPGGPLFGVQFSQLLCSDVKDSILGPRPLPLGLSADPGGIPLYKGGDVVGGIGVELDGLYTFDRNVENYDSAPEEIIAIAGAFGFDTPEEIKADRITVGGQALRFADINRSDVQSIIGDSQLPDLKNEEILSPIRDGVIFGTPQSGIAQTVRAGVPAGFLVGGSSGVRFPTRGSGDLSGIEVDAILDSSLVTASRMRAAIRKPLNTPVRVSIFVVDSQGAPLGFIRSQDAPVFGIDVALQKARTVAFFSSPDAGASLRGAGLGGYVDNANASLGVSFNGAYAF